MAGLVATRPDPVADTLRLWASEPAADPRAVCAFSVLDFVEQETGCRAEPSPRAMRDAELVAAWRDPEAFRQLAGDVLGQLGCTPVTEPDRGDVGLCDLPGSGLTVCLALGRSFWAARGDGEVVVVPAEPEIAWRLPCRPH